ncbi:MAG: hypothetical protein IE933_10240 [Sphingomonadales bacterium]|nr:hypothetical protein [Sphingomonadales bacterium]MBD3772921.1 hypothetical protein [Paracoccaceae bacterium]
MTWNFETKPIKRALGWAVAMIVMALLRNAGFIERDTADTLLLIMPIMAVMSFGSTGCSACRPAAGER